MKKHILLFSLLILALSFAFTGCDTNETTPPSDNPNTTYTIQYTDEGGNHTINVKNGEVYSIPSIPQKTGYEFLGLFDMEEGGTQFVSKTGNSLAPYSDNTNLTLYPQFKAKEYTLVFDYQGAAVTGVRQTTVTFGTSIGETPTNLSLPNKEFTGWYTAPNKEGIKIADTYGVDPMHGIVDSKLIESADEYGRICVYAGFKFEEYTVTLCIHESILPEDVIVEWGTPISAVQCETRLNGLAVLSWSKTRNDTELKNVFTGKIEANVVLYACEFAPVIEFNSKGGEPVAPIVARAGNTIYLPTPVRENYTFMGWYETGGNQFTGTAMPSESTQLMASWQANIVLDENGGTEVEDVSLPKGAPLSLPTPERAGYIFAGWYDQSGNKYESSAMPEESVLLIAKYYKTNTETIVVIQQSDNYHPNGGTNEEFLTNSLKASLSAILPSDYSGNITVNAHMKVKYTGTVSTNPAPYIEFKYYPVNTASSSYLLHTETITILSSEYVDYNFTMSFHMTGNTLFCSRTCNNIPSWYYVSDYYLNIAIPDMSTLY